MKKDDSPVIFPKELNHFVGGGNSNISTYVYPLFGEDDPN